ncbi:MAG: asparagine synthase B [Chloroflexi bacterium]|nr:asparagine synthase B [Chloroflexota bacterium]MCA2000550.1 asparagine synthase B [Chloroflexota bacterium]
MCGIAGALQRPSTQNVKSMIEKLAHRGPDGSGVKNFKRGTLGHARLAILDAEGGTQPMGYKETWIAFNGEIYNYREFQKKFLPQEKLKTHSDTEVLLHLYRLFGADFVSQLDGMFAFVIYQNGEYLMARDPLGIKPLYYGSSRDNQRLYFASEVKALQGLVSDLQEFPAGHWFDSSRGWKQYYRIEESLYPFEGGEADALPQIKSTLQDAVRKRMLADVPVGVSLSGGLDSSIVSLLACEGTEQLHSFAVGVEGSEDLAAARQMSEFLKTQHHERVYSTEEMVKALPDVLYYLETFDPALVRSAIPNYFLAELASHHVKVFLTGEGADELYAGYDYLADIHSPQDLQAEMIHITEALHNTNLQRADRMSMAFGLEARVPFLDVESVALALSLPPEWKTREGRVAKHTLRRAFENDLPANIVHRPRQKFSKGAGSSDLIAQLTEEKISDAEFQREAARLKSAWDYSLPNKEALYYYKTMREFYEDDLVFPVMGHSRSL